MQKYLKKDQICDQNEQRVINNLILKTSTYLFLAQTVLLLLYLGVPGVKRDWRSSDKHRRVEQIRKVGLYAVLVKLVVHALAVFQAIHVFVAQIALFLVILLALDFNLSKRPGNIKKK